MTTQDNEVYCLFRNAIEYPNGFPYKDGSITFKDVIAMHPHVNVVSSWDNKTPLLKAITMRPIQIPDMIMEEPASFYRTMDDMIMALLQHGADPKLTDAHGQDMLTLYKKRPMASEEVIQAMTALLSA